MNMVALEVHTEMNAETTSYRQDLKIECELSN